MRYLVQSTTWLWTSNRCTFSKLGLSGSCMEYYRFYVHTQHEDWSLAVMPTPLDTTLPFAAVSGHRLLFSASLCLGAHVLLAMGVCSCSHSTMYSSSNLGLAASCSPHRHLERKLMPAGHLTDRHLDLPSTVQQVRCDAHASLRTAYSVRCEDIVTSIDTRNSSLIPCRQQHSTHVLRPSRN
jgi:hypothetical protein